MERLRFACASFAGCCLIAACTLNTQGESALPQESVGGSPEGGLGGKGGTAGHGGNAGTGGLAGSGGVAGSGGISGAGGIAGGGTGGVAGAGTGCVARAGGTVCTPVAETCNGLDDDCDGVADNGNPGGGEQCTTGQPGACGPGTTECKGGKIECSPVGAAVEELCDGIDNNCDGSVDESNPGGGEACDTGLPGVCNAGNTQCNSGQLTCSQTVQASGELCDGLDNDCDGAADEDNPEGGKSCDTGKPGPCATGISACADGKLACTQSVQPSTEVCNGADDNCDASIDEGCPGAVDVGDEATMTPWRGGNGGTAFSDLCPAGMVLIGITGTSDGQVDQVQGRCATLELMADQSVTPYQYFVGIGAQPQDLALHGTTQGASYALDCPPNSIMTRVFGRASNQLNQLGIACSEVTLTEAGGSWAIQMTEVWASAPVGGTGGGQFSDSCPAGMAVRTIDGRAASTINAIRIGCHLVSLTML